MALAALALSVPLACAGPQFRSLGDREDTPIPVADDDGGETVDPIDGEDAASEDDAAPAPAEAGADATTDASVAVAVDIGDCTSIDCPAEAPYPVGCSIKMDGDSARACAAGKPSERRVYFKEGDACNGQSIKGTLFCSPTLGVALSEQTCPLMHADGKLRGEPKYPATEQECPGN